MKKYRVQTDKDNYIEFNSYEEAEKTYLWWKDDYMAEGVIENESYVELVGSNNDFEDYKVMVKVLAVIDYDRTEIGTPREEGFDWDYWAKWQEIVED